jgi:hypothetical protein
MIIVATIFAYLLLAASYAIHFIIPAAPEWIAPFTAVLSWIFFLNLGKNVTWQIHTIGLQVSTLSIGILLDLNHPAFPLYTVLMLFVLVGTFLRLAFFTKLGYLKFYRMESVGMILAFAVYPTVNLLSHASWVGWAVPSVNMLFLVFYNMDSGKELRMWKSNSAK